MTDTEKNSSGTENCCPVSRMPFDLPGKVQANNGCLTLCSSCISSAHIFLHLLIQLHGHKQVTLKSKQTNTCTANPMLRRTPFWGKLWCPLNVDILPTSCLLNKGCPLNMLLMVSTKGLTIFITVESPQAPKETNSGWRNQL